MTFKEKTLIQSFFRIIFILVLLSCSFQRAYCSLFSNSQVSITQDVVWIYSNSSTLVHVDNSFTPIFYNNNIRSATNLSQPIESGLKGVLYIQDSSQCSMANNNINSSSSDQFVSLPTGLPKIALIYQQEIETSSCSVIDNILQAQNQGAVGVIMYGNTILNPSKDEEKSTMIPTGTNIAIAVYFVDIKIGEDLFDKVMSYKNYPSTSLDRSVSVKPYIRTVLLPASPGGINAWEVTLLIVSILLVTSFLASVIMHWHIWRKRRRQEYLIEQGLIPIPVEMLPMGKQILDKSQLDSLFPIIDITSDYRFSSEDPPVCVICLESITVNSKIRKLPCEHEYHCHCIDPWLTEKSSECPLCKYDCNLISKPSHKEKMDTNVIQKLALNPVR
ncbi:uncharacterized protein BX663DRAFT_482197 [Cokeromyces recurvatus]|uniref:uncharacterized protein n=1 Tax=Cokeromyces recurvatus TaxID=90255 RepID=UPI00221F185F|nr:uncharacterized protein BX663DRAFT_482197 [Cokeromyces recurvatus]KAI7907953.1 hypothetical protein BX663DRAFT_482197 [Cokeromyces recurvatus]